MALKNLCVACLPVGRVVYRFEPKNKKILKILYVGDYADGGTPLPIPNRAVKPVKADGTWTSSPGRVGSRQRIVFFVQKRT